MTTETTPHKTRSTLAWRPRKGQWFNAYLKDYNKLHPAGPFKCTKTPAEYCTWIEGDDVEGDAFVFKLKHFRLEPADGKCGQ